MTIRIGADCETDEATRDPDPCCPRDICEVDLCGTMCSFIQLLPNGPLWDRAKAHGIDFFRSYSWCDPFCPDPDPCYTLVNYAAYSGQRLYHLITSALWPALRESSPETAVTTLDDWLDRLGWQDCYNAACRDPRLGVLTPYEVQGPCGPIYCPIETPPELECAVKRGIVRALSRLRMGIIKNVCSINWVIEPLGAYIESFPRTCILEGVEVAYNVEEECCQGARWLICGIDDKIEACPDELCTGDRTPRRIDTLVVRDPCNSPAGSIERLRPNVLAAECIVRSLLPSWSVCGENNLVRCSDCAPDVGPGGPGPGEPE